MGNIDKGVFFVKNDKVALELYDLNKKFVKFIYDGKNTAILTDENNEEYILENIVFEIRSLLKNGEDLMMLKNENNVVEEIYFLKVKIDDTLAYEDDFNEKSVKLFDEIKDFVDKSAV
ncbi:MAG: hypothetical protein E7005_02880 [Alphaproteobacteria bacterium]|nr:hypothetical protein [Alphaproteobacteria bacterium]